MAYINEMVKIKYILILLVSFHSLNLFSQNEIESTLKSKFLYNKSYSFLISSKPVTNREYIIYIMWLYNTEGIDYPAALAESIPGIENWTNYKKLILELSSPNFVFDSLFALTDPYVREYIFNPKYIDYPVIGVSWLQANYYCKWFSDRYNEYKLIKDGYFYPDSLQSNEECFNTESYLFDQYYGKRKKDINIKWSDKILVPSFRIPTCNEIDIALTNKSIQEENQSYDFSNYNILSQWAKWYLKVNDTSIILFPNQMNIIKPFVINQPKMVHFSPKDIHYKELTLDLIRPKISNNVLEIFTVYNQFTTYPAKYYDEEGYMREKDSIGMLPLIIIDENSNGEPIYIEKPNPWKNYVNSQIADPMTTFYIFRFAANMRPNQYKP